MKCNYDGWTTTVPKSINDKMVNALKVMMDGKPRTRSEMLWAADIDPNPRSDSGFAGFEKTDYYLYKKALIKLVRVEGEQKVFKITAAGVNVVSQTG